MPYSGDVVAKQKQLYKEWKTFSEPSSREDRKEVDPVCLSSKKEKPRCQKGSEEVLSNKTQRKYVVVCTVSL